MDKKAFFKQFFEIEANSSLSHAEDAYKDFDFALMVSNPIGSEPYIVVFSPVNEKFNHSIILELPQNEHHINLGWTDIFLIDNKTVRKANVYQFSNAWKIHEGKRDKIGEGEIGGTKKKLGKRGKKEGIGKNWEKMQKKVQFLRNFAQFYEILHKFCKFL